MNERCQDIALLRRFACEGEQSAFADVVRRHLNLVFGTALRKVEDTGAAQEIAQNVFGALARKAWRFAPNDSLPAWLHKAALLEARSWLRGELRRRRREETAAELGTTMNTSEAEPAFAALVPLLDEALLSLREKDRAALLLRFYESHSLREVGAAVGVSEDAARMRVQAALEKVATFFKRRGFKTASVAGATAALEHTATTASAAVADAVVTAALQVAPPAMTGLGLLLARLVSVSHGKTAAVGVALTVALLLWLGRDQRRAGPGPTPQPLPTQLAANRNDTLNLLTNGRTMRTSTSTQLSLRLLSNALLMATNALAQPHGQAVVLGGNTHDPYGMTNVPATAQSGVVAVAAGGIDTAVLKNDGSVVVWVSKDYDYGETDVPAEAQSGVTAIAVGNHWVLALKNDGSVISWGAEFGPTNVPPSARSGVVAIAAGFDHSVVLRHDGSVISWGSSGDGKTNVPAAANDGVMAVAAGYHHSVALKTNGLVLAWGRNQFGESSVPIEAQSGVTAIGAGEYFTVVLKQDGSVFVWGRNAYGETIVPTAAQTGVKAIAAGAGHILALKNDGSLVAWGAGFAGQTNTPPDLSGVTAISAGIWHSVALIGSGWDLGAPLAWRPSGNAMIVSWPTNATGFTLQSTQTLSPPRPWLDVTNPPAITGGQFIVTNPVSGNSQFFRLKKP